MRAAGQGLDAREDGLLVETQLAAGDGLVVEHGQGAALVDLAGVGVVGDGRAGEGGPVFADGVLRGGATDAMLDQQGLDQGRERLGGAAALPGGHVVGHATKGRDEFAGGVVEGILGRFGHGVLVGARPNRT